MYGYPVQMRYNNVVSLEWHCQPGVISSAVPDCAVDEIISSMFH